MGAEERSVVFVGAGVIGLTAAWRAAEQGLSVTLADPHPGGGASWVAAGMLAPVNEVEFGEFVLARLLVAGSTLWPAFAAELAIASGLDPGYRTCGTLTVALDSSDRMVINRTAEFRRTLGLRSPGLTATMCRDMVPALSTEIRGGIHAPDDHQVDNRALLAALRMACERQGVRFVRESVVGLLHGEKDAVQGVQLASGMRIHSSSVILATGADTARLGWLPERTRPPIRPVKGHILRLRGDADAPLLPCTLRGLVHGRSCYLVPRSDGSIVVGATSEELGFDRTVRVGPLQALLEDSRLLVPALDELELLECRVGFRPGSPENMPFVGWTSVRGLGVATGHYRNGILLAPLTAAAISAMLRGEAVEPPMDVCGLDRCA